MRLQINTIAIEFTFDLKIKENTERLKFYRGLYGWKSSSNFGKYLYIKDGILSNIKYLKPTRSTIIVSIKNAKVLRNFFKKYKVVFNEKIILLDKLEARKLGFKFSNNFSKIYEELKGNENLNFSVDI